MPRTAQQRPHRHQAPRPWPQAGALDVTRRSAANNGLRPAAEYEHDQPSRTPRTVALPTPATATTTTPTAPATQWPSTHAA
jgi:hypothetical protein